MNIAIIGTGNLGGALATQWANTGHNIHLGVQNLDNFKGKALLNNPKTNVYTISEAVAASEVVLLAIPPDAILPLIPLIGNLRDKIAIDATNAIRAKPDPYPTVFHCIQALTQALVVKCFNTTGFENMLNPNYGNQALDMLMAGDNHQAKDTAKVLSADCGFANCIDFGKSDKVELLEQWALCWINLAIIQGHGRNLGFKLITK